MVAYDTFANNAATTVPAGADAPAQGTQEMWTVTSSSAFPAISGGQQFHVTDPADSAHEIILVSAVSGNTWTVTRGAELTTPVTHAAGFTVQLILTAGALNTFATTTPTPSSSSPFYIATDNGISYGVTEDQSVAINTLLAGVPGGSTVFFPSTTGGGPTSITDYYVSYAVEVPRTVRVMGPAWGIGTVTFTALPDFADSQIVRNWQKADVTAHPNPSNPDTGNFTEQFYAPNLTSWGNSGLGNNYILLENIAMDINGNSNVTCLSLLHPCERTYINNITFRNTDTSSPGSDNCGLSMFGNTETGGNGLGDGRFNISNITSYGQGWKNFFYLDGSNGETNLGGNLQKDVDILGFTSPANVNNQGTGDVCSDSTIYARYINRLRLTGHVETPAPNGVNDTACIRLVNVASAVIADFYYAPGAGAYRPFIRATADAASGASPSLSGSQAGFTLRNVECTSSAFQARSDSCTITSGSGTVTDAAILAADAGRPVYGAGIPFGAYVATVDAGVSFTLGNNFGSGAGFTEATCSGTVTLSVTCNVIEDETAVGGSSPGNGTIRHFQYHPTLFTPQHIISYDGPEISWLNYPGASTCRVMYARSRSADAYGSAMMPAGAVAESWPRGPGPGFASAAVLIAEDLHLTALPLYPGDKVSNLSWWSGSTALSGGINQWAALFDENRGQVAISSDAGGGAWGVHAEKTFSFTTASGGTGPWTASLPAVHYAGLMVNATTVPTLQATIEELPAGGSTPGSAAPALTGTSTTGLTNPASAPPAAAAPSYIGGRPYVLVT